MNSCFTFVCHVSSQRITFLFSLSHLCIPWRIHAYIFDLSLLCPFSFTSVINVYWMQYFENYSEFDRNDIFRENHYYRSKVSNVWIPSFGSYKWIVALMICFFSPWLDAVCTKFYSYSNMIFSYLDTLYIIIMIIIIIITTIITTPHLLCKVVLTLHHHMYKIWRLYTYNV